MRAGEGCGRGRPEGLGEGVKNGERNHGLTPLGAKKTLINHGEEEEGGGKFSRRVSKTYLGVSK